MNLRLSINNPLFKIPTKPIGSARVKSSLTSLQDSAVRGFVRRTRHGPRIITSDRPITSSLAHGKQVDIVLAEVKVDIEPFFI